MIGSGGGRSTGGGGGGGSGVSEGRRRKREKHASRTNASRITSRCVRILPFGGGIRKEWTWRTSESEGLEGEKKGKSGVRRAGDAILGAEMPSRVTVGCPQSPRSTSIHTQLSNLMLNA